MPIEEEALLKTLNKHVDMNKIGERDWLAIEVAIGGLKGKVPDSVWLIFFLPFSHTKCGQKDMLYQHIAPL
jgi:hypothetical protein